MIHHFQADVLRFLKTCYTICFRFYKFLPIYEGVRGEGGETNQNFKIVIESSVIHHWKAGVLRFLKTYYTICLRLCKSFPIYEGGREESKIQNRHRLKCDTPSESWCSEVSENMLYNMFLFLLMLTIL